MGGSVGCSGTPRVQGGLLCDNTPIVLPHVAKHLLPIVLLDVEIIEITSNMRAVAAGASPCQFSWPTWRFSSIYSAFAPSLGLSFHDASAPFCKLGFHDASAPSVDLAFRFDSVASVFYAFCWFSFSLSILVRFFCVAAARLRAGTAGALPQLWAPWPLLPQLWAR